MGKSCFNPNDETHLKKDCRDVTLITLGLYKKCEKTELKKRMRWDEVGLFLTAS